MYIPYIKPIENLSDMLNLLSNSPTYKERLEKLAELEAIINKHLKRWETIESAEQMMASAEVKLRQATELKLQADSVLAKAEAEALLVLQAVDEEQAQVRANAEEMKAYLQDRQETLSEEEDKLMRNRADLAIQNDALIQSRIEMTKLREDMLRQKAVYTEKLAKLHTLVET